MPLKTRRTFPPGGYLFFEARTGWNAPGGSDFDGVVAAIIAHRKANPRFEKEWATDQIDVENELDQYTCARLNNNEHYCDGGPPASFLKGLLPRRQSISQRFARAHVAGGVEKIAGGTGLLLDWLGSGGKPVAKELAEARASVCVTCPKNQEGGLSRFFTVPASEMIRKQLAIKNDMKLETSHDAKLGVCGVCYCPLKLKVHTPIEYIKAHSKPEWVAEFPDFCWIKKELQ